MNKHQLEHSIIRGDIEGSSKNIDESSGTTAVLPRNQISEEMDSSVSTLEPVFKERRVLKVLLHRLEDENVAELIKKAVAEAALKSSRVRKKKIKRNETTKNRKNTKKSMPNLTCPKVQYLFRCSKCRRKFASQERLAEHTFSNCDTERVFGCDICDKSFIFKRYLIQHQTPICHSLRTYKCKICQKSFRKNDYLKRHMLVHREGPPKIIMLCDICGKSTTGGNHKFQEHLRLHSGEKPFSCQNCGKSFRTKTFLSIHLTTHSEKKLLICAMCGKGFRMMKSLKKHMTVHGMVTLQNKHKCNICGKLLYSRSVLSRHIKTHFNEKQNTCKICGEKFTENCFLRRHILSHGKSPYPCTLCTKSFKDSGRLKDHLKIHSGEKPYSCKICGRSFALDKYLKRHFLLHSNKSLYPCTVCTKSFKSSSTLKEHLRIHSGEKPYSCIICGQSFALNKYLKRHILSHGKSPYPCTLCTKSFKDSGRLKDHLNIHSGEKPYSCKICGQSFALNNYLKRHILSHGKSPYPCTLCTKSFKDSGRLKDHLKIHSGEKPYSCKICGQSFTLNKYLKRHFQLHSNKSLYPCTVCTKSFKSSSTLKEHLRIHSGEKPYSCIICGKRFRTYSIFKRHMFTHSVNKPCLDYEKNHDNIKSDEKPILCKVCGIVCPTIGDLEVHVTKMHTNNQENIKYICKVPNYHEYSSFLLTEDKEKQFLCKICGILCTTLNDLEVHIESHPNKSEDINFLDNMKIVHKYTSPHLSTDDEKPLSCNVCGIYCTTVNDLGVHTLTHSNKLEEINYLGNVENVHKNTSSIPSTDNDKPFLCNVCGTCCTTVNDLEVHTLTHPNKLEEINYLGNVENVHKNTSLIPSTDNDKPFLCNVCGICCTTVNDLEVHTLTHSNKPEERNYQVENAHKYTSFIPLIDNNITHSITHKIQCEICMKTFTKRYSLTRHVKSVHNKVDNNSKTYVCKFCKKMFMGLDRFQKHIASQHNCEVPSTDNLTADIKLESSSTDVSLSDGKSQICKECGQVFSCELSLGVHYNVCMLKLSSFEGCEKKPDQKMFCCAVCKTGFKTLDALSLHMIIHETLSTAPSSFALSSKTYSLYNEDQFEQNILNCNHCGKKFTKMNDLKTHMQTHFIIPFTCGICQISFNKLDFLRQHINTEHQNITFSNDKNDDNDVVLTLDQTLQHRNSSEKYQVIPYLEEESKISKISDSDKKNSVLDLDSVVQYLKGETSIDLEAGVEISFKNY